MLGNRFIGQKHKVLNDFGSGIPFIGFNGQGNPFLVQDDFAFREIKINGAPLFPVFPEDIGQLLHLEKHGHQLLILFLRLLIPF